LGQNYPNQYVKCLWFSEEELEVGRADSEFFRTAKRAWALGGFSAGDLSLSVQGLAAALITLKRAALGILKAFSFTWEADRSNLVLAISIKGAFSRKGPLAFIVSAS